MVFRIILIISLPKDNCFVQFTKTEQCYADHSTHVHVLANLFIIDSFFKTKMLYFYVQCHHIFFTFLIFIHRLFAKDPCAPDNIPLENKHCCRYL